MNIDQCKTLLQYRATKSGFNGNLSPNDFNSIWNSAEQRHFNFLYKQYGVNQDNTDSIIKFKSDPLAITIDTFGKYIKPGDLLHIDSIMRGNSPVIRVNNDHLSSYLDSEYDQPGLTNPIYVEYKSFIQFYPLNLLNANMVYLMNLIPSKWAYTLVSGRPVYNSSASVQPIWSDADIDEIIYLAGVDLGLNLRDQLVIQMNDQKAKENT